MSRFGPAGAFRLARGYETPKSPPTSGCVYFPDGTHIQESAACVSTS